MLENVPAVEAKKPVARKAGFKVYAAPWAQLTHSGTYNFNGTLPRV